MDHRNLASAGGTRLRKRLLSSPSRHLILLAPTGSITPGFFDGVQTNPHRYDHLLSEMQRLRGSVYLQDGAIGLDALIDGKHKLPIDPVSWHLLVMDQDDKVCGCSRYREHESTIQFSKLGVSGSPLAACPILGHKVRSAVGAELSLSRRLGLPYVELGGWALKEQIRGTTEALRMALTTYALAQALGGGVGITTATTRHGSSSILRKVGGSPFEELPAYHDLNYHCEMEVLRFYSWAPNLRYATWISEIKAHLRNIPVFAAGHPSAKPAASRFPDRAHLGHPPIASALDRRSIKY